MERNLLDSVNGVIMPVRSDQTDHSMFGQFLGFVTLRD